MQGSSWFHVTEHLTKIMCYIMGSQLQLLTGLLCLQKCNFIKQNWKALLTEKYILHIFKYYVIVYHFVKGNGRDVSVPCMIYFYHNVVSRIMVFEAWIPPLWILSIEHISTFPNNTHLYYPTCVLWCVSLKHIWIFNSHNLVWGHILDPENLVSNLASWIGLTISM